MGSEAARLRTGRGTPPVFIAMHWRGHSDVMNELAVYEDAARDSAIELEDRLTALREGRHRGPLPWWRIPVSGSPRTRGPELGRPRRLGRDGLHGLPILIGASRKRFVSSLGVDRDAATAAISAYSAEHGAWAVRVHEVPSTLAAVRVGDQLLAQERPPMTTTAGPGPSLATPRAARTPVARSISSTASR